MRWIERTSEIIREVGVRKALGRAFARVAGILLGTTPGNADLMVSYDFVAELDWTQNERREIVTRASGPYRIAWIMSPPGKGSGGHQNLFRFIEYAERAGHENTIFLHSTSANVPSLPQIRSMLASTEAFAPVKAAIELYDESRGVGEGFDALFATGWETAYPVYLDDSAAKRFYFVQDYEPNFYAVGAMSLLAENTYKFGFTGLTAGAWLSNKLSVEYGMTCAHFDFAVNSELYTVTNSGERKDVFFYARPETPRRAFELGLITLGELARRRPGVRIHMAGSKLHAHDIPFKVVNHGPLELSELNALYNECRVGLVFSLTNLSLLPLELISSGVIPVVNTGSNNEMVSSNPEIRYVPANPRALSTKMIELLDSDYDPTRVAASVDGMSWERSGDQFVQAFERLMRNE